jgi:hypothetical protein
MTAEELNLFPQRQRFLVTHSSQEFFETMERLQREGHAIPTLSTGKRNAEWIIEVRYADEMK